MKYYKKFLFILAILSASISIFFIVQIYGKYSSSTPGSADIPIAKWNIKVNDTSIGTDSSIIINPVFSGSEHIAPNVIAPGAEGYFDINLDFRDVEVSFSYDITLGSQEDSSAILDIIPTGYSIDNNPKIDLEGDTHISDNIYYGDNITSRTIRVYVMWNDDLSTESMNNAADTATTKSSNSTGLISVNVAFTQLLDS